MGVKLYPCEWNDTKDKNNSFQISNLGFISLEVHAFLWVKATNVKRPKLWFEMKKGLIPHQ